MSTSNRHKKLDADPRQLRIFDAIEQARTRKVDHSGALRVIDELRAALNQALKNSPLSRHQVAGEMSHMLNEEITKTMIDSWTADSKSDRHIPAEFIPAFCRATGDNGPVEVLIQKTGLFALQGPEALRSEIHKLRDDMKALQREIKKREQFLDIYRGGVQ